jgi:membrane associated rhomboid family serine protease
MTIENSGDGHDEDNPWGNGSNEEGDNIISLELKKKQKEAQKPEKNANKEQLINLPVYTKYFAGLLIAVFVIVNYFLPEDKAQWMFLHLGFIPGRYTGTFDFEALALLTPFTHVLLHGSWLHLLLNTVMLVAFGSGVERWIGGKRMVVFFVACSLFGIITHFALNYHSIYPVVGASGGLSGMFMLALIMINRVQGGAQKIWPFILLWIGISVIFGLMGSPDGNQVAWAAHVGGFLGGFIMMKIMRI